MRNLFQRECTKVNNIRASLQIRPPPNSTWATGG